MDRFERLRIPVPRSNEEDAVAAADPFEARRHDRAEEERRLDANRLEARQQIADRKIATWQLCFYARITTPRYVGAICACRRATLIKFLTAAER
jgi:hypothetical protein